MANNVPLGRRSFVDTVVDRPLLVDYLLLTLLLGYATTLMVGDFDIRLAHASSDDDLMAHAYWFRYPERFRVDVFWAMWAPAPMSSMMNWLPALLFKYLDVDPMIFHVGFIYLQNVLLGLACFRLAHVVTGSRQVAWISGLFVMVFRPHWWNLGLYGDLEWQPYPAFTTLALVTLAFSFCLQERIAGTLVWLIVGGLIHPALGLFAAGTIGLYWLVAMAERREWRSAVLRLGSLAIVTMIFMAPPTLTVGLTPEVSPDILRPLLLRNGHIVPWANPACGYCLPAFGTAIAAIVGALLLVAAWFTDAPESGRYRLLVVACCVVNLAAAVLQPVGYWIESISILRLIPLRATLVLWPLMLPAVIGLVWRSVRHGPPFFAAVGLYLYFAPSPVVLVGAGLASFLPHGRAGAESGAWRWPVGLAGLAFVALDVARGLGPAAVIAWVGGLEPTWRSFLFPFGRPVWWCLAAALVAALVYRLAIGRGRGGAVAAALAAAVVPAALAVVLIDTNRAIGSYWTTGERPAYTDVQRWARSSTAVDASFIMTGTTVYYGWRSFTHRPVVATWPAGGVYFFPAAAVQHNERLFAVLGRLFDRSAEQVLPDMRAGFDFYMEMDTAKLRAFAAEMGADYVVRRAEWAPLDAPVAYRNASYVVYDLRRSTPSS